MKWRVTSFLGCMLFSFFVIPAQIQTTLHRIFPQLPQPLYDVSCPVGNTALASTTNPTNGHLKAYLCVDALGNTSFQASASGATDAFISAQTFSPLSPPYNAVTDRFEVFPVDLSGGGKTLVSAGLFGNVVKGMVGTCLLNGDFGSFGNGNGVLFTVLSVPDTSHVGIDTTIQRAFANQACDFTTLNFRTPLTSVQNAVTNGSTIQLPCGPGMLYSGGQIFSSFPLIPSGGTVNIAGCPITNTIITMDYSSVNTNTTEMMQVTGGVTVFLHDVKFVPVGFAQGFTFGTGAASSITELYSLGFGKASDIEIDNWIASSYTGAGACFRITNDGSTWRNVFSNNCGNGIRVFNRGVNLVQDNAAANNGPLIIEGQEDGDVFTGGNYSFITINGNGGNPTTIILNGVNTSGSNGATPSGLVANASTGVLNIILNGGRYGGSGNAVCAGNQTGILGASNIVFHATNVRFDSCGTGNGINNPASSTFINDGGNYFTQTGAAHYTGAGTFINHAISESGSGACAASTATITYQGTGALAYNNNPFIVISDVTTSGGARISARTNTTATVTCTGATDTFDYSISPNKF